MKKVLPVLWFLIFTTQAWAQNEETDLSDSTVRKRTQPASLGKFAMYVGGGLSWRIAQVPEDQNELTNAYYKDLLSGNGVDVGATYYFTKRFGVGIRYNSFLSNARVEDVGVTINGVNKFGNVEDKTSINLYAATFGGRIANKTRTGYFFFMGGIGLMTYKDKFQAADVKQVIKGYTPGILVSAGYAVVFTRHLGLEVGFNYGSGSLTEYTIEEGGRTRTQQLPADQPEGLQHFDFKTQLVFLF